MKKNVRLITETAVMLALLIALQALTKPMGQLVTGSCVNAVLAIAAIMGGFGCGLTVAAISPVLAFWLGITTQPLTVPAIAIGNAVFVLLLSWLAGPRCRKHWLKIVGCAVAAVCKAAVLYGIVGGLICGLWAQNLLDAGLLKAPMLNMLPATFGWPQLITALIGGAAALLILPALRKALKR